LSYTLPDPSKHWLSKDSKDNDVAVSSRCRFARNLEGYQFAPHADGETLAAVDQKVRDAIKDSDYFKNFEDLVLDEMLPQDRKYLKECRLISAEMEKGGKHRSVYVSDDGAASILVNEEDHLRIQSLASGLDLTKALGNLLEIHDELEKSLSFCRSERLGYLTACPTNVGTGFRASVMVHLPGLNLHDSLEKAFSGIALDGITIRGFYGENSEYTGDYYQISNEITLGKTVDEIMEILSRRVDLLLEHERESRISVLQDKHRTAEDQIHRSHAILSHAIRMDTEEAMQLLSKLRLGIDQGLFTELSHSKLNQLVMEVQPAHIDRCRKEDEKNQNRDEFRAGYLRKIFATKDES
jgi:protein arginine kinase